MYKDFFTFTPSHTMFLIGNTQPAVKSGGHSLWRRLRLIPFPHTVPTKQRIPDLQHILCTEEGPGILAWMIQGTLAYNEHGLGETPAAVAAATEEYRINEDSVGLFLTECYTQTDSPGVTLLSTTVRGRYERWCRETGDEPLNRQTFGRALTQHGVERYRSHGRKFYTGLIPLAEETNPTHE